MTRSCLPVRMLHRMHRESRALRRRASASRRTNMNALPDELVERLFFFLRRDSDLQQLMAMQAVSRRLKRLLNL